MFILAGTKSGDIYELIIPDESRQQAEANKNQDMVKLRLNIF